MPTSPVSSPNSEAASADSADSLPAGDRRSNTRPPAVIYYALQPLTLIVVILLFLNDPYDPMSLLVVISSLQILLLVLERIYPARRHWLQPVGEKLRNLAIVIFGLVVSASIGIFYANSLAPALEQIRENLGFDIWPTTWPLVFQVLLCALLSEFIWYWFHRAEHRYGLIWKLSGHGAHHSFKHLEAINFGANHPMEYFVLLVPALIVEALLGAGIAAAGSVLLVVAQAGIAHSNLRLNSKGIDWFFTTNTNHVHHHSIILEESNTNYGCAIIFWDRLFGTFSPATTKEAGIGPTEPSLLAKLMMPFREPSGSQIAP